MAISLLLVSCILISCVVLNKVSHKLGIPMLLMFILLGMFFGSDGVIKIHFDNYIVAEQICSIALILIMFYGGFGTKWSEAKKVAGKAILLSTLGVVITAVCTGLFCHYVIRMSWLESFLIGAVISSTDAASVFSILRSKRLNLKYHSASLLELESGSNDPCSYMLTMIVLAMMGKNADMSNILWMITRQFIFGALFGVIIAYLALWILKKFRFASSGFDAIFVMAIAILAYAAPAIVDGNGYLSAYIVGIFLGNKQIKNKQSLVHFFDGVTGLMQMLIFFLLGLLAFPSQLPEVIGVALLIALFITFVGRPIAVFLLMSPFHCTVPQQLVVSWAGLRGAASIVFAVMATVSPVYMSYDVFHIVFGIVLFSILFQGTLLPYAARKLDMIDKEEDVFKTFSDYSEEVPIQFIQFTIAQHHPWANKPIQEIILPPDSLIVFLQRGPKKIAPNGKTLLLVGDQVVLSAKEARTIGGMQLSEISIQKENPWIGKYIAKIELEEDKLIVMILRKEKVIIPNGSTKIQEGDVLVMNSIEDSRQYD